MTEIKPLKWSRTPPPGLSIEDEEDKKSVWALGVGGHYQITSALILWMAENPFIWQQHKTLVEAKAAAQENHETLVRAFLGTERAVLTTEEPSDG